MEEVSWTTAVAPGLVGNSKCYVKSFHQRKQNAQAENLFAEETAKRASRSTLATLVWVVVVLVFLVLDEVFGDAAHDGATDCSQNAVISLVAGETAGETTGKGSA